MSARAEIQTHLAHLSQVEQIQVAAEILNQQTTLDMELTGTFRIFFASLDVETLDALFFAVQQHRD